MKHPNSQELALYVSNEVTPEERHRLAGHLRECAPCAADVAALERTARRLSEWQFPALPATQHVWSVPVLKWGIAAALVLGIGFAFGRYSTPQLVDSAQLRVDVERSVKASLAADLRGALEKADAQSQTALAALEARLGKAADEKTTQLVDNVVAAVRSAREENLAATRALVESLRREHADEIRQVHIDLETVAANADDQLRFAHFKLGQLTPTNDHK
jgi:Putative zinc-finger